MNSPAAPDVRALPRIAADSALFLDFDGTLAKIAPRPDAVVVSPTLPPLLSRLQALLGGALAVVSGRPVAELDALLAPLSLPAAGVHGVQRRSADGRWSESPRPDLSALGDAADAFAARRRGVLVERKDGALALHYRLAPNCEADCIAWLSNAVRATPGLELLRGKQVVEAKPAGRNKGTAIAEFLAEPPFSGRRPLFAGDDVTDEAGFAEVQRRGGFGLKVGPGASCALHRLTDPEALQAWLAAEAAAADHNHNVPATVRQE